MKLAIRAYSVVLLFYTGWRTYDFISSQLPKNDISFWLSIAFLFSTEVGLILWHEAHLRYVTTEEQDAITKIMTWVDFTGSLSAGVADMILRQTLIDGFRVPPMLAQFLIFGLPLIMAVNVGAVILFEQNDAVTQEQKAEKALRFKIHKEAMSELGKDKTAIAEEKKQAIYRKMRASVTDRIDQEYGSFPAPHKNGNKASLNATAEQFLFDPECGLCAQGVAHSAKEHQVAVGEEFDADPTERRKA